MANAWKCHQIAKFESSVPTKVRLLFQRLPDGNNEKDTTPPPSFHIKDGARINRPKDNHTEFRKLLCCCKMQNNILLSSFKQH
mmetsp:Transcript_8070/g.8285  ORF Transcript_8070/g.8285 Transcript_8070/m.8285 type:complete len:83 (-) Transcript_8070:79-327(-)